MPRKDGKVSERELRRACLDAAAKALGETARPQLRIAVLNAHGHLPPGAAGRTRARAYRAEPGDRSPCGDGGEGDPLSSAMSESRRAALQDLLRRLTAAARADPDVEVALKYLRDLDECGSTVGEAGDQGAVGRAIGKIEAAFRRPA